MISVVNEVINWISNLNMLIVKEVAKYIGSLNAFEFLLLCLAFTFVYSWVFSGRGDYRKPVRRRDEGWMYNNGFRTVDF